jgi:nucleotide-binding universal stress UspA family protein
MSSTSLRVLVALDGTPASETILAALMPLARSMPVHLTLYRVAADKTSVEEANAYLGRMKGALALHRISTSIEAEVGEPGPKIIARLQAGDFEYGAMTTHGRQGLDRIMMGSVAETVVRSSETPLFINRPDAKIGDWKKIVVPLDGSSLSEEILDDVAPLAREAGATLHLVNVAEAFVAGAAMEFAYTAVTLPDMSPYLELIRKRLAGTGLNVETEALIGPSAHSIVRYAADIGAGLIALTTHGRSGLRRVIMGSVAEQIFRTAPCPILVLPAAKAAKRDRVEAKNP